MRADNDFQLLTYNVQHSSDDAIVGLGGKTVLNDLAPLMVKTTP